MNSIIVLGSTGSVGAQSLEVARERGYRIEALTAGSNVKLLEMQARRLRPRAAAIADEGLYSDLKIALADTDVRVLAGSRAISELAAMPCGRVVNAIVGIAGLRPTLSALKSGNGVALANKEALIAGGELVMSNAVLGKNLFPIDSEHSAIWQCLQGSIRDDVSGVILTASGGPFFGKSMDELRGVTREQALRHPNWDMGAKITVDCATLMNKGLEFIEAMWLFSLSPEQIEVVVHRQSVMHSAVEYRDGAVIAQLGVPDMRLAIQYALTYPQHLPLSGKRLSLTDYGTLTFENYDAEAFPCLPACMNAAKKGGLSPCVANGANEEAVALFLDGKLDFPAIGELVTAAVEKLPSDTTVLTLDKIEETDRFAREFVRTKISERSFG